LLPVPTVKKGKWSKERERTKSGRWRRKRSDADKTREQKHSRLIYALATVAVIVLALVVLYFLLPEQFWWVNPLNWA
jgi:hypothetical protein